MSAQLKRKAVAPLDTAFKYAMALDGRRVQSERSLHTDASMNIASNTIIRFMLSKVGDYKCTKLLALSTMSPSKHGVSATLAKAIGHIKYQAHILKPDQLRAMERFVMRSRLFDGLLLCDSTPEKLVNTARWRRATYTSCSKHIMGCMDVIGNPQWYNSANINPRVAQDIKWAASALSSKFEAMRQQVLEGVQSSVAERAQLCLELSRYVKADNAWKIESFRILETKVSFMRHTLCNMLSGLTSESNLHIKSPFWMRCVYDEALRVQDSIDNLDDHFTTTTSSTEGMDTHLERIKASCEMLYPHEVLIAAPHLVPLIPTAYQTEAELEDARIKCNMDSFRVNHLVLSGISYTPEELRHEAALMTGFRVSWSKKLRDNEALRESRFKFHIGCDSLMRAELDGLFGDEAVVRTSIALDDIYLDLKALGIHSDGHMLHHMLANPNLQRFLVSCMICDNLQWSDLQGLLNTIIYAMSQCIGNASARRVLYKERVRERSLQRTMRMMQVGDTFDLVQTDYDYVHYGDAEQDDSSTYALDLETTESLHLRVKSLDLADNTCTTSELGVLFADTLAYIHQELHHLDIKLTNAYIKHVSESPVEKFLEAETATYQEWFKDGMRTINTAEMFKSMAKSWTTSSGTCDMSALVFQGFLSLMLTPRAEELSKIAYPETFLLDVNYICVQRKVFFGNCAQAALLVIVTQRLSESSVESSRFEDILKDITNSAPFQMLKSTSSVLSSKEQKTSIKSAVTVALRDVKGLLNIPNLVHEVERETSNVGYPTTPIASAIARKWSLEMQGVVTKTSLAGAMQGVLSGVTFRPEVCLPKAAMVLGEDAKSMMVDIVTRVNSNVAVHRQLYNKLFAELVF
jgi:hypothetical protein